MNFIKKQNLLLFHIAFIGLCLLLTFACGVATVPTGSGLSVEETVDLEGRVIAIGNVSSLARSIASSFNKELVDGNSVAGENAVIDAATIIVADLSNGLSNEEKMLMANATTNEATLVLKNANKESMKGFAIFGALSDTVVIINSQKGREQKIIVEGQDGPAKPKDSKKSSSGSIENDSVTNVKEVITDSQSRAFQQIKMGSDEIVSLLKSELSQKAQSRSGFTQVNISQARATVIIQNHIWDPNDRGGEAAIFGSFEIELSAVSKPTLKKYIKIKSVGTGVSITRMKWDKENDRGYFTRSGSVEYYFDNNIYSIFTNSSFLPTDWRRIHLEPESMNNETTYTSTTGWSVGAEVSLSLDSTAGATLSASYSQEKAETRTIPDFRVVNKSTGDVCEWKYEYSSLVDDRNHLFRAHNKVNRPVSLATGMLEMENEAVYEAPYSDNNSYNLRFVIRHDTVNAYTNKNIKEDNEHRSTIISIDLSSVKSPVDNGLDATYYSWDLQELLTRRDDKIDFDWGAGSPHSSIPNDKFVVKWKGLIKPPATGEYTFYTSTDGGAYLNINNKDIVGKSELESETEASGKIHLYKDKYYPIGLLYIKKSGNANAKLYWSGPGLEKEIVPWIHLYTNDRRL